MALNTNCAYSTVKNTSGSARKFAFLPPHGQELAANEEITVYGDIFEAVLRGDRGHSARFSDALLDALSDGALDVVSTPSPILYDVTDDVSKMLKLDNGVLYAADASWEGSSSSSL